MFMNNFMRSARKLMISPCFYCRTVIIPRCNFSDSVLTKYSKEQQDKIIEAINNSDLSSYNLSRANLIKFSKFRCDNGQFNSLLDIENVGLNQKTATKLFDSILTEMTKDLPSQIKGQFIQPKVDQVAIKNCASVLSVNVTLNSVSWTLVNKQNYEVKEWDYYGITYPEKRTLDISNILDITKDIIKRLPVADMYVMKAEPKFMQGPGSNSRTQLIGKMQKSQMISMLVALFYARTHSSQLMNNVSDDTKNDCKEQQDKEELQHHNIFFLRSNLPSRLYRTLVGTEEVSSEPRVARLFSELTEISSDQSHAYIPKSLQNMYFLQNELHRDVLGHSLLLCLTFMDLCIYKNKNRIAQLLKQ